MLQNKMWAKEVEESSMVTLTLMKEIATHVTLDNNVENQRRRMEKVPHIIRI